MLPFFGTHYGNPSSEHAWGWAAAEAVHLGRERVARLIGAGAHHLTFTSGATESVNLALKGLAAVYKSKRNQIITFATEHSAVLETVASLEKEGLEVDILPVEPTGEINLDHLQSHISERTLAVAAMAVNSETGVIHPMKEIGEMAHEAGAFFMSDATQAAGKIPIDVEEWNVDLLALSSHKMYGPKGVGALYIRSRNPRVSLLPQIHGGGHENGLRSGTQHVPGIVGMGLAAELALGLLQSESERLGALRSGLESELKKIPGAYVNGEAAHRVSTVTNVTFPGARMRDVFPRMREVAASTGSACKTTSEKPSHVLTAMGLSEEDAFSSIRLSLGRFTTEEEIQRAAHIIMEAVSEALPGR